MLPFGRLSGILQPLFSFRSEADGGVGDFAALDPFFAWMQRAQQRMLMVLPLLPTTPGDPSPYSTRSAFGLNPLFIHLEWMPEGVAWSDAEKKQLAEARASPTIRYDLVFPLKTSALERAFATFEAQGATVIADTRALHGDPGCTIRRGAGCRSCGRAAAEARARLAFAAMRRRVLWSRCFRSAGGG